ncbi:MAG TPA: hypothetical protein VFZ36_10200 [Vicinamibacterales bacterium]
MSRLLMVALPLLLAAVPAAETGQRGMGAGRGMMQDAGHQADMQVLHALFDNRAHITRKITVTADGVDTLTESDVPAVTKLIQEHVASMAARVEEARPIHQRDPLFQEIFKHTKQIDMTYEHTATGIRVIERSTDPYVVKLIQAHADVISAFIANGMAEAMKNHPVPVR